MHHNKVKGKRDREILRNEIRRQTNKINSLREINIKGQYDSDIEELQDEVDRMEGELAELS